MFGKIFSSTFTGSMVGKGPVVFAVWAYVIANVWESKVELNPTILATIIGTDIGSVKDAIELLCSPDPDSRNKDQDGRRLIKEGQFQYHVVSHEIYRKMRSPEDRRAYNAEKKRESRARQNTSDKDVKQEVNNVSHSQPQSAQTETETETDKTTKRRKTKMESEGLNPEAILLGQKLCSMWPSQDPEGRVINKDIYRLVNRLVAINKEEPIYTWVILETAAKLYLSTGKKFLKAPQYFFSLTPDPGYENQPPFKMYADAAVTKARMAQEVQHVAG